MSFNSAIDTCNDCRYGNKVEGKELMECRLNPPTTVDDGVKGIYLKFVNTVADMWCGQWKERR
jgi:hypothetical protein